MIRFARVHTAPRPLGASASVSARPPSAGTTFSLLFEKNPMRRPSGDQNGSAALSVPSSRRDVIESSERTHNSFSDRATDPTTNATIVPSGDTATAVESGYTCSPGGARIDRRETPVLVDARDDGHIAAATAAVIAIPTSAGHSAGQTRDSRGRRTAGSDAVGETSRVGSRSSSSSRASAIELRRRFESFSRQRRSRRATGGGRSPGSSCHFGSSFNTLASVIDTSSPSNARFPVSIS